MEYPSGLEYDPDNPIGIMLSGGGARGAFQVGVWEVLFEHPKGLNGHLPAVISGTSAGSINGALIAAGLSPKEMLNFWVGLGENPPVTANDTFFRGLRETLQSIAIHEPVRSFKRRGRESTILRRLFSKHRWYRTSGAAAMGLEFLLTARFDNVSSALDTIKTSYIFNTDPFRERLREAIGDSLRHSPVKLAINTVDINTGAVVRIVSHAPDKPPKSARHYLVAKPITVDMVLASASIPVLFNPVNVQGHHLWDGGLLVNSPMAPAVALGAKRLVPVLVTVGPDVGPNGSPQDLGSAIERLADTFLENAYNVDRKLLLAINDLAERFPEDNYTKVDLFRALRPSSRTVFNAGSYLFFEPETMRRMYRHGKDAAHRWLANGPLKDTRDRVT